VSETIVENLVEGDATSGVYEPGVGADDLLSAVAGPLIDELVTRARRQSPQVPGPNGCWPR
jgi:hypothetical protein